MRNHTAINCESIPRVTDSCTDKRTDTFIQHSLRYAYASRGKMRSNQKFHGEHLWEMHEGMTYRNP